MEDSRFIELFRLPKCLVHDVIAAVEPRLGASKRSTAIHVHLKVLVTLSFYGYGSYQKNSSQNFKVCMSQPSLSRCIKHVTNAINDAYFNSSFVFPKTNAQRRAASTSFQPYAQFPGVLGCIDCTQVAITRPWRRKEAYYNHKGYYSINVQMVCDEKLKILSVLCYPGSVHDQFIFSSSNVNNEMKRLHEQRIGKYYLLGDSGYMAQPYMLTPVVNAIPNTPDEKYTKAHCSTRNRIERCFGVLKSRFMCLSKQRVLHYTPTTASKFIMACAVHHNLCVDLRVDPIIIPDTPQLLNNQEPVDPINEPIAAAGRREREFIIQKYFSN